MNITEKDIQSAAVSSRLLIGMTKNFVEKAEYGFAFYPCDNGAEAGRFGFRSIRDNEKKAYIVTAEETALELGSPRHESLVSLLWTEEPELIKEGVWVSGIDLKDIHKPQAEILIAVVVHVPPGFNPESTRFRSIVNLSNKIPGYMSRSVPGKLWIRISRGLLDKGFSSLSLGMIILHSFHDAVPGLGAVEVIVAAGESRLTAAFEPVYNLGRAYSGQNRKLSLDASGALECEDLVCTSCDEKVACDTIRDIMVIKKMKDKRGLE